MLLLNGCFAAGNTLISLKYQTTTNAVKPVYKGPQGTQKSARC